MKHRESGGGLRHPRIERSILEELRALLRDDVADPTLEGVVVTAVVLSADQRHARVHWACPPGIPIAVVDRALARAKGFLRARLTDGLPLKRTPDLGFVCEGVVEP